MTLEGLIDRDHEVAANSAIRSRLLDLQRLTRLTGININLNLPIVGRRMNYRRAISLVQQRAHSNTSIRRAIVHPQSTRRLSRPGMDIQSSVSGSSVNTRLGPILGVADRNLCGDGTIGGIEIDMTGIEGSRDGAVGSLEMCDFAIEVLQSNGSVRQSGLDGSEGELGQVTAGEGGVGEGEGEGRG